MKKAYLLSLILRLLLSFPLLYGQSLLAAEVKRDILAFWDSSEVEEDEYTYSPIHKNLEFVFNHYGLRLTYVDVNRPLPPWLFKSESLKKFKGMVSWFNDNSMNRGEQYIEFLRKASELKYKVFFLGEPGFFLKDKEKMRTRSEIKEVLELFGLSFNGDFYSNPLLMEAKFLRDQKAAEFERSLEGELHGFWGISVKQTEGILEIKTGEQVGEVFHPITLGKTTAMVQQGYEIYTNPNDFKVKWRIDPFFFVKYLFVDTSLPIPDVTTQCGKRASFVHIDGDGFINLSLVDKKSLSGEIILEKIIKKYKVPTSASVVTSEISPDYLGSVKTMKLVRELFELPYVEPASHTLRHPMSWEKIPNQREREIYLSDDKIKDHKGSIVGYLSNLGELDYKQEVVGSVDYINEELSPQKKAKIIFWTGSCRPPLEALKLASDKSLLNLNGGDGRFDITYPSYSGLSPLYRKIGIYVQPYSAFANENIYTNLWEGPFSGFRNVIGSFKNTESPRRVKPINIYYHFYSGERTSSLMALDEIYDYLIEQDTFPLYASDYSQMVGDWERLKLEKLEDGGISITDYGLSRNLRIELEGKELYPDYRRSKNVVGHNLHQGRLYLTLKRGKKAVIYLQNQKPKSAYIESCNGFIDDFDGKKITAESRGEFSAKVVNKP